MEKLENNLMDSSKHAGELWKAYLDSFRVTAKAGQSLVRQVEKEQFVTLIKSVIKTELEAVLALIPSLHGDTLKALVPALLPFARANYRFMHDVHNAILALPIEWLIDNIEKLAEPTLKKGYSDEFQGLLHLYSKIDSDLTNRLARQAIASEDPEVQEVGKFYLNG